MMAAARPLSKHCPARLCHVTHMPFAMCTGTGAAAQWYKNTPGYRSLKVATCQGKVQA
jgi:hypothetical protein